MKYKNIPHTDLNVSTIALGTWVLGGQFWGGCKGAEGVDAIQSCLDCGVNLIDTAPVYGNGQSEEIVGKAIAGRRDHVILATKCGLITQGKNITNNLKATSITEEVEKSLRRLKVDMIDLYQCHWPDPQTPLEETMDALNQLKQSGKIRYIGVSNFDLKLFKDVLGLADIVSTQNHFSILERTIEEELLSYCDDNQISVLTYGALGGGVLTGKYEQPPSFKGQDARSFFYKYYEGEAYQRVDSLISELKAMGKPLNQIAINWVRQKRGVTSVLVGCRNAKQVQDNMQAANWELTDEEIDKINELSRMMHDRQYH